MIDWIGSGSFSGHGCVDFRTKPRPGFVSGRDCANEALHCVILYKSDGTAAESATGHAGTVYSGLFGGHLDHEIEFGATDFVVVAQAPVRFSHQAAKQGQVT